jgi:beta-phosphoglucomutase
MLRAILFDFDGVLTNTEPVHLKAFQKILLKNGIKLSREDYYKEYLGMDDRGCFKKVFEDQGKELSLEQLKNLINQKNEIFMEEIRAGSLFYPGVKDLVSSLQGKYYLGIVSGALGSEIKSLLQTIDLIKPFQVIVAADDVKNGKPDPEGFLLALKLLKRDFVLTSEILLPEECLVIEDSPWGIEGAKVAGMKCVALTTSYPAGSLKKADWILENLQEIVKVLTPSSPSAE